MSFASEQARQDAEREARIRDAAPDLYAALKEIIDACDRCVVDDDKSIVDEFTDEIEQRARVALGKAEGWL